VQIFRQTWGGRWTSRARQENLSRGHADENRGCWGKSAAQIFRRTWAGRWTSRARQENSSRGHADENRGCRGKSTAQIFRQTWAGRWTGRARQENLSRGHADENRGCRGKSAAYTQMRIRQRAILMQVMGSPWPDLKPGRASAAACRAPCRGGLPLRQPSRARQRKPASLTRAALAQLRAGRKWRVPGASLARKIPGNFSKINRPAWRLNMESCAENNF